jgi:hypothetical protein
MKLKLIDKQKKGFARYCPTFARGYEVIVEKVRRSNIQRLAQELQDNDKSVKLVALKKLKKYAEKGVSITEAKPALVKLIWNRNPDLRKGTALTLGLMARNGEDIDVVDDLIATLAFGKEVARENLWALAHIALKKKMGEKILDTIVTFLADPDEDLQEFASYSLRYISADKDMYRFVIDSLGKALGDENIFIQDASAREIEKYVVNDRNSVYTIIESIMKKMQTDSFKREAEKNSAYYLKMIEILGRITKRLEQAA